MATLQQQIDALAKRMDAADKTREDTHKMVADMHRALMEPQIGQGDKSVIERVMAVTIDIESGKRAGDNLLAVAKRLAGLGAIIAAIAAALKFGEWPGITK